MAGLLDDLLLLTCMGAFVAGIALCGSSIPSRTTVLIQSQVPTPSQRNRKKALVATGHELG
jgi:hypothetical protein